MLNHQITLRNGAKVETRSLDFTDRENMEVRFLNADDFVGGPVQYRSMIHAAHELVYMLDVIGRCESKKSPL